ncbi:Pirin-related protein [Candidatus Burkholderia pumila]|uniref:Pirin-related protein n=1 Tax=Candidatus Burkholderia pumila TaxID=1090375 RepID=A0ABR5HKA0_9BURK|nr:Pirin-related protein [Candidatus Burkholderia pumila]
MKVIADEALGVKAAIETRPPILYQHFSLQPIEHRVPKDFRVFAYPLVGHGAVWPPHAQPIRAQQMVLFKEDGDTITLAATDEAVEVPLKEPVVRYGPFVTNTEDEIRQVIIDYQAGRMARSRTERVACCSASPDRNKAKRRGRNGCIDRHNNRLSRAVFSFLEPRMSALTVIAISSEANFQVRLDGGTHEWIAEPESLGGGNKGPEPASLLLASLGACTNITLRMYAKRKAWPLQAVGVQVSMKSAAEGTVIDRHITITGPLDDEQRERLLQIANACAMHKVLSGAIRIDSKIDQGTRS